MFKITVIDLVNQFSVMPDSHLNAKLSNFPNAMLAN